MSLRFLLIQTKVCSGQLATISAQHNCGERDEKNLSLQCLA